MLSLLLMYRLIFSQPVEFRTEMIRLSHVNQLGSRCGPHHRSIKACTQIVGQALTADCVADGEVWRIRARASYIALIYIVSEKQISHEFLHVRDIELGVGAHVKRLRERSFLSKPGCDSEAAGAKSAFSEELKEISLASIRLRQ